MRCFLKSYSDFSGLIYPGKQDKKIQQDCQLPKIGLYCDLFAGVCVKITRLLITNHTAIA
jgi:hypothetical protein